RVLRAEPMPRNGRGRGFTPMLRREGSGEVGYAFLDDGALRGGLKYSSSSAQVGPGPPRLPRRPSSSQATGGHTSWSPWGSSGRVAAEYRGHRAVAHVMT